MEGVLGVGVRIVVALIVIGVIVSPIFIILGYTRGTAQSGLVTMQSSTYAMQLSQ